MGTFQGQAGVVRGVSGGSPGARPGGALARRLSGARTPLTALVLALTLALAVVLLTAPHAGRHTALGAAQRSHGITGNRGLLSLPPAARAAVSDAVGADSPAYSFVAAPGELRAANPAQHLGATFTSSGLSVTSGDTRLGLSLRGVGYGASSAALAGVEPHTPGETASSTPIPGV